MTSIKMVVVVVLVLGAMFACHMELCKAKIIGAFVLPHGGIALDPSHFNTTNETSKAQAIALHKAANDVGRKIRNLNPEVVFLSTPHGIADMNDYLLYMNSAAFGFADTDNCQCPPCCFNLTASLDFQLSQEILEKIGDRHKLNVSGVSGFGPPGNAGLFPLRWGEVIPLFFVGNSNKTKSVIMSQPSRRYNHSPQMIPELLRLGGLLYSVLHSTKKDVVIVISADLAHTHDKDGPYGYSPAAEPFDQACGAWASTLEEDSLLETAASLVDDALSCGYTGLVMLHGLLRSAELSTWRPHLYANYHPSYYGMMVAEFLPDSL
ncbi:protein CA_C1420-like [Ptychodera flava]|uniref:protein CA_C1420-like n=1 Tax=Ptychodera flava TaxID=63121 RepID=UPI00396A2E65